MQSIRQIAVCRIDQMRLDFSSGPAPAERTGAAGTHGAEGWPVYRSESPGRGLRGGVLAGGSEWFKFPKN